MDPLRSVCPRDASRRARGGREPRQHGTTERLCSPKGRSGRREYSGAIAPAWPGGGLCSARGGAVCSRGMARAGGVSWQREPLVTTGSSGGTDRSNGGQKRRSVDQEGQRRGAGVRNGPGTRRRREGARQVVLGRGCSRSLRRSSAGASRESPVTSHRSTPSGRQHALPRCSPGRSPRMRQSSETRCRAAVCGAAPAAAARAAPLSGAPEPSRRLAHACVCAAQSTGPVSSTRAGASVRMCACMHACTSSGTRLARRPSLARLIAADLGAAGHLATPPTPSPTSERPRAAASRTPAPPTSQSASAAPALHSSIQHHLPLVSCTASSGLPVSATARLPRHARPCHCYRLRRPRRRRCGPPRPLPAPRQRPCWRWLPWSHAPRHAGPRPPCHGAPPGHLQ